MSDSAVKFPKNITISKQKVFLGREAEGRRGKRRRRERRREGGGDTITWFEISLHLTKEVFTYLLLKL